MQDLGFSKVVNDYEEVVRQALSEDDPKTRLRLGAGVARQIRGAQSAAFDLSRGSGVVAPELAKLEQQRERLRYQREEGMIIFLRNTGKLNPRTGEIVGVCGSISVPSAGRYSIVGLLIGEPQNAILVEYGPPARVDPS